jgi:hypothetical protein
MVRHRPGLGLSLTMRNVTGGCLGGSGTMPGDIMPRVVCREDGRNAYRMFSDPEISWDIIIYYSD